MQASTSSCCATCRKAQPPRVLRHLKRRFERMGCYPQGSTGRAAKGICPTTSWSMFTRCYRTARLFLCSFLWMSFNRSPSLLLLVGQTVPIPSTRISENPPGRNGQEIGPVHGQVNSMHHTACGHVRQNKCAREMLEHTIVVLKLAIVGTLLGQL